MDLLEKEIDIYHDIDIILKQISTDLDILQSQQDKLLGKDLIQNLNKQLSLLEKQVDSTKQKIKIAQGEVADLQATLSGYGVAFNQDGTIANYREAYESQFNYVNGLITQYNAMSAAEQEGFKDTVEQAKQSFNDFTQQISNYDKLITETLPGLEKDIQSAIDKEIEIKISKFNMEIEIRLDMSEAERDWNKFKKEVIDDIQDDDILGDARAELEDFFSYYKEEEAGIIQVNTQHVKDIIEQLESIRKSGTSTIYGDNQAQALEDLQNYYKQLMNDLTDVDKIVEEIKAKYLDMMDEAKDKFGEQVDLYENLADMINHDMKVIQLVYGEESYSQLEKYYQDQEDNYNKQLDFQKQQISFWKEQMNILEEGTKEWDAAKENWLDAVKEWEKAVENAIENLQDKYLNAINEIFQNLNNKVTSGLGLDYVGEQWELINKNADQYLDSINATYNIQKLEDKYLKSIAETDSVSAQRLLNESMEQEIGILKERDRLTQYDIDRAELKYQIALKQIALQEAQQNKSSMRLKRDSQGNYSYQFIADENAVASAQEEISDLYNKLYNLDIGQYQNNLDELYKVWDEFQQKMAEAAQINDPEARAQKELLIKEEYGELINGIVEQNEDIRNNLYESSFLELADLYDVDIQNFQNLADTEKEILLESIVPYWTSGIQEMAEVFAGEDGFLNVCKDAFNDLKDTTEEYMEDLNELQETANVDFNAIAEGIDETIGDTQQLLQENDELIVSYERQMMAIQEIINQLEILIGKYSQAKMEAIAATQAAYGYWQRQQEENATEAAKNEAAATAGASDNSSVASIQEGSIDSGDTISSQGDGNLDIGDVATYSGKYYYDSYGTSPAGSKYSGVTDGIVIDKINDNPYGIHIHSADGLYGDLGWIKRQQLTGFDTGGYTGDWSGEMGRLALLHQKELVLNKQDTKNVLDVVTVARNMTAAIGNSTLARLAEIGTGIDTWKGNLTESGTLEQNVHIEANFPNVKNAQEIENALNNLVNIASMRANRKR